MGVSPMALIQPWPTYNQTELQPEQMLEDGKRIPAAEAGGLQQDSECGA